MRLCLRTFVLSVAFLAGVYALPAQGQSQPQQTSQPSSSAQAATQSKAKAQTQSAAEPQMQVVPGAQQESLADAARKAKAQKAKSSTGRVMTDDDMSRLGGGVSVVGGGNSAPGYSGAPQMESPNRGGSTSSSGGSDEKFWRGRAREILEEISATDQQIANLKAEIAKSGPTGVDPSTGLTQNVIIIHDRNAQVKQLEERKAILQRRLEDLADEGRKAGADSSWFR